MMAVTMSTVFSKVVDLVVKCSIRIVDHPRGGLPLVDLVSHLPEVTLKICT